MDFPTNTGSQVAIIFFIVFMSCMLCCLMKMIYKSYKKYGCNHTTNVFLGCRVCTENEENRYILP
jgi:hypothetical protein